MSVLVTGASGFIGHAVVSRILSDSRLAIPLVRRASGMTGERVIGTIGATTDWRDVLSGCDTVVHLVACVNAPPGAAKDQVNAFRAINVDATLNLAKHAARAGVQRFVFVSSAKVNGEGRDKPYRETDAPAPEDAYGASKLEAEQGLLELARQTDMEVVIIRPPLVYGPGVRGNFAALCRWVERGRPLPFACVENRRSLVGLGNLADFIALCADRKRSPRAANEVFMISDGEDLSTPQLLRRIARASGASARLLPVPVILLWVAARTFGAAGIAQRLLGCLQVDSSKARELLAWSPPYTIDDELRRMAQSRTRPADG